MKQIRFLFAMLALAPAALMAASVQKPQSNQNPQRVFFKIDITDAGPKRLDQLKKLVGGSAAGAWWSEVGATLLVSGTPVTGTRVHSAGFVADEIPGIDAGEDLRVLVGAHQAHSSQVPGDFSVVVDSGRVKIIAGKQDAFATMERAAASDRTAAGIFPLEPDKVVVRLARNDEKTAKTEFNKIRAQSMKDAAARVDRARWWRDVQTLSAWNRHISAPGNIQARDWLRRELEAIPGMEVSLQDFRVQGRDAWNVVGILPGERFFAGEDQGRSGTRRSVIIGGHFDSISERPSTAAPGAEDNASGAAGVVELARVLATMPRTHDVIFAAFSGEEQGLHGSAAFVEELPAAERERIAGVITMDMIAYARGGAQGSLGVLIETRRDFADFGRLFTEAASRVTRLQASTSYNPFGSDHMSFLDEGIPAILSIDADWDSYGHYHRTSDTPDKLTPELAHEILKMNAAVAAALAVQ